MEVRELASAFEDALQALLIRNESIDDEDQQLRNVKSCAYYLVELAKRWGGSRDTMSIDEAVRRSKKSLDKWIRSRATKNLEKELKRSKELGVPLPEPVLYKGEELKVEEPELVKVKVSDKTEVELSKEGAERVKAEFGDGAVAKDPPPAPVEAPPENVPPEPKEKPKRTWKTTGAAPKELQNAKD